jgi:pilus assembly protein CpaE
MTARKPSGNYGRVIAVLGAKGGCGTTTLATNLGVALTAGGTRSVCLVDLDLTNGDLASTLDVVPDRTLANAADELGRFDPASLESVIVPLRCGMDGVLAPTAPGEAEKITAQLIGELLACLNLVYDHVVVDVSAQISTHVLAVLDQADQHVLITTPERPALRHLRLTLDVLDLLPYRAKPRAIVVNRSDSAGGIDTADIERSTGRTIAASLPSTGDIPAAVNDGVPLVASQPDHPYSAAVRRLVTEHLTAPGSVAPHGRDSK